MKWVYQCNIDDFSQMTNLSKKLSAKLSEVACIHLPELLVEQKSNDGTVKWLLKLDSGNCIETVFIPEENRVRVCVEAVPIAFSSKENEKSRFQLQPYYKGSKEKTCKAFFFLMCTNIWVILCRL